MSHARQRGLREQRADRRRCELFEQRVLREARAKVVEVHAVDVPTIFRDFDDYWYPFLGGQGPAPSYTISLSEERRLALREHIRLTLPISHDGSIRLITRAWAVRGVRKN